MAIQEELVQAPDCSISLNSATFTGPLVNFDDVRWALQRETNPFSPASSGINRYTTPKKSIPDIVVRVTRGLGQTFKDLKNLFDDQEVNLFTMTDFIADQTEFDAYVAEYGALGVVGVAATQPAGAGMADITLRFGWTRSGYTPA